LSLVIFQEISAVRHPDLEAEIPWSHPLLHDLVHFQPVFPPGKTPGAFMEAKAGICLYPTTHLAWLVKTITGTGFGLPLTSWRFQFPVAVRKPVAIVTRVIYNGNESLT
jgi:hypothetical protein